MKSFCGCEVVELAKIVIGIFSAYIGSMNADFAIKLAEAAVNKEHEVFLWLSGNGVTLVRKNQKEFKDYSYLEKKVEELIEKGVKIAACEACSEARGIHKEDLIDGVEFYSMDWFMAKVAEADRVLMIGES